MALSAGQVSIAVKPDTAGFGSSLKSGILGHTAGVGESMGSMILGGLKTMAGPIAAVTAAFSVKHLIDDSVKAFEDLAGSVKGMQRVVGGSVEGISGLRGAMQLAGVPVDNLNTSMGRFAKNLATATDSGSPINKMFKEMGVQATDAHGKLLPVDQLLPGLADKFKEMPNGPEKTAAAMALFGRQGATMIPFLNKGSEGIAELTQKAKDMGLVLDDTSMRIFGESKESARNFAAAIQGLKATLGQDLLPVIDAVQNIFRNAFTPVIQTVTKFLQDHREVFLRFADTLSDFGKGAEGISTAMSNIGQSITNFIQGGGIQKMISHFIDFRANLFQAIGNTLPTIINQVLSALIQMIPQIAQTLLSMIPQLLGVAQTLFSALITAVGTVLPQLITSLANMLPSLVSTITSMLPSIIATALQLFLGLVDGLVKALPQLLNALLNALPSILQALVTMLPAIVNGAIQLFLGLVNGLVKVLPTLIDTLINKVLPTLIQTLIKMLPTLINGAVDLFLALVQGLAKATPQIVQAVMKLIPVIVKALIDLVPQLVDAGFQLLQGLIKGLWDNAPRLLGQLARDLGNMLIGSVKAIFGIKSPSRVFYGIGVNIGEGLANGIEFMVDPITGVIKRMGEAVTEHMDTIVTDVTGKALNITSMVTDYNGAIKMGLGQGKSFSDAVKQAQNFTGGSLQSRLDSALGSTTFTNRSNGQSVTIGAGADPSLLASMAKAYEDAGFTKTSGPTIIYNAAPNDSISAEQKLIDAVQRAKVLGAV